MLLRLLCAEHNCALRTGATLQRLSGLLSASTHEPLHALLHSALLPAAAAALRLAVLVHPGGGPAAAAPAPSSSQELGRGQEAVRLRGRAWALLGLARLHLAAPPAGADPAAKRALKAAHLDARCAEELLPELQARDRACFGWPSTCNMLGAGWLGWYVRVQCGCGASRRTCALRFLHTALPWGALQVASKRPSTENFCTSCRDLHKALGSLADGMQIF